MITKQFTITFADNKKVMIRKINKTDKDFYINSVKAFYNSDAVLHRIPEENIYRTFNELMNSETYAQCYIFEKDEKRAGYALLAKTFSQEAGGEVLWIDEIFILPEFRCKGLGSEFFVFLKENSKAARLRLEFCPNNEKAIEIYKRQGFQPLRYGQMIYGN